MVKVMVFLTVLFFIGMLIIKRFVYFQPGYSFISPKENFQDIYQGNLHAWFKQGNEKVILFCHGNAGNLSHRQDKLIELIKIGCSVLIFDYSGFGQSKGVPNEQLCYSNASIFVEYLLRKGYKSENIIPYGESLGAAVAAYTARKYRLPKMILESGLPGVQHLIKNRFPFFRLLGIIFNEFDTVSFMKGYNGKSLVLHCLDDEIVPYSSIGEIKNMATKMIDMDGGHNNPIIPWEKVKEFINL